MDCTYFFLFFLISGENSEKLVELQKQNKDLKDEVSILVEKVEKSSSNHAIKLNELKQQNKDLLQKINFLDEENKKYIKLEVLKSEESKKLDKENKSMSRKMVQLEADVKGYSLSE